MYPVRKQQLYSFYAVSLKETIIYSDRTFVRLHKADLYKVQPIIDNKGKVKRTGREWVILPANYLGQSKRSHLISICYTQSNTDDTMLILAYLPHVEILFVSAGMAIAGTR